MTAAAAAVMDMADSAGVDGDMSGDDADDEDGGIIDAANIILFSTSRWSSC